MSELKHTSVLRDADRERREFSMRLIKGLRNAGYIPSPTSLSREFNLRSPQTRITAHGCRKWLIGDAIPTQARLRVLAEWLGVSLDWLRFGAKAGTIGAPPVTNGRIAVVSQVAAEMSPLKEADQTLVLEFVRMVNKIASRAE
jgi:hypothetical protein